MHGIYVRIRATALNTCTYFTYVSTYASHIHTHTHMRENESARERAVSPLALESAREHIAESGTGCKATTMTTGNGVARRSLCSRAGTREKESIGGYPEMERVPCIAGDSLNLRFDRLGEPIRQAIGGIESVETRGTNGLDLALNL